jgi:hypothetical protein
VQQLDAWETLHQEVSFGVAGYWHRGHRRRTAQTCAASETPAVSVPAMLRSRSRTRRRRRKRGRGGSWASLGPVCIDYPRFWVSYVSG